MFGKMKVLLEEWQFKRWYKNVSRYGELMFDRGDGYAWEKLDIEKSAEINYGQQIVQVKKEQYRYHKGSLYEVFQYSFDELGITPLEKAKDVWIPYDIQLVYPETITPESA